MTPPADREIFEGKLATYWFDEGILVALTKGERRSMENAREAFAMIKRITNNRRVPLLYYIASAIPAPDKESVKFISKEAPEVFTAIAFVSEFGLGKIVRNILFKDADDTVPLKQFVDYDEAKAWLKHFL